MNPEVLSLLSEEKNSELNKCCGPLEILSCDPSSPGTKNRHQVKLLITSYAFCFVQRATAKSKTGIFRGNGVAEAPPGYQAGWSDCMYFLFSFFMFILFAHLEFPCKFLFHEGTLRYWRLTQKSESTSF
jgi:hypothetical protein